MQDISAILQFFSENSSGFAVLTGFATYILIAVAAIRNPIFRNHLLRAIRTFNRSVGRSLESLIGLSTDVVAQKNIDAESLREIIESIESLKSLPARSEGEIISSEVQHEMLNIVRQAVEEKISPLIQSSVSYLISSQAHEFSQSRSIEILLNTAGQLKSASTTVAIRGFVNLAIGIIFAAVALYFLKESVEMFGVDQIQALDIPQVAYFVGIRISLAILITLIAYFFLSLYRKSLEDVKYYQNEITFISGKVAALSLALSTGNKDSIDGAIPFLMDTDRNRVTKDFSASNEVQNKILEKIMDKIPTVSISK